MDAPITRPSNIDKWPLPGRYLYTDFLGAEPVEVQITVVEGQDVVIFPPLDDDGGAEVLLKDMAACANWREHFRRIR